MHSTSGVGSCLKIGTKKTSKSLTAKRSSSIPPVCIEFICVNYMFLFHRNIDTGFRSGYVMSDPRQMVRLACHFAYSTFSVVLMV